MEEIVLDYRNDYRKITVDTSFTIQGDYEVYNSSVMLPNAISSTVMRFHSQSDTSSAYQAYFYNGESYVQAVKIYKNCIRQIKGSKIHWIDKRIINFKGKAAEIDPNLSFATCDLRLDLDDRRYERFCVEVSLQSNAIDFWQVMVNCFSKPLETDGSDQ